MDRRTRALDLAFFGAAFFASLAPASGQIVHSSDTVDWARMLAGYHWKDQDTMLNPVALVKFDLGDVELYSATFQATLNFYVEKSPDNGTVSVYYVAEDSWSFNGSTAAELFNWPTDHLIQSYGTGQTGWRSIDITSEVAAELPSTNPMLTVKFGDVFSDSRERIASPSAHRFDRRPYIRINAISVVPGQADLTLGGSDIQVSDPTPAPDSLITVAVTARNFGTFAAQAVLVRLYDGHHSLFMAFDGRSDDGTIWIERSLPVDAESSIVVDLSWAFGVESNLATAPVYYIGFNDPEAEDDFTWLPLHDGWYLHRVREAMNTGKHTRLWVAVGFTVAWETPVEHYLDAVTISIE